ncbi:MAG: MauE/DoxX family redox-associated membrane protein [Nannocystaceae bacterium]|nr:glutaredoxin [bacterium]
MSQTATLYRMETADHTCPYGLKSKWLLERKGFDVDDRLLETREQTDAFKEEHDVETTPQTFLGGQRIGGYDDLRAYFDLAQPDSDGKSYQPVLALFAVAALASLAISWATINALAWAQIVPNFVALAMAMLAMLKLQDVRSFSTMFLNYDLLAQRWVPYAFIYPFAEAAAALLMLAGVLPFISAPLALLIGGIGAVSVIKAVWIDGRELECACVGGGSSVPLGFVSLTENLAMVGMAVWVVVKTWVL